MKKITKVTHYWLFKPLYEEEFTPETFTKYHHVRVQTEGETTYQWVVGYDDESGNIVVIDSIPMFGAEQELEKEFQATYGWEEELRDLLKQKGALNAIKFYKELKKCGLREAKDYVFNLRDNSKILL
ncbi:MAG: hypothetical protein ACOC22_01255 [bacterium]